MKKVVLVYSNGAGQNVRVNALPKEGETVRALSWDFDRDGAKGTNVAVALGRLGMACSLITRNGDDMNADLCEKWLNDAGVDTTFARRDPSVTTPTGVVFIDKTGRNTIVLSDFDPVIPASLIDEGLAANKEAAWLVTGFEIAEESAVYAVRAAKSYGIRTIINASPVSADHTADLGNADIVVVNEVEARQLLEAKGLRTLPEDEQTLARLICEKYAVGAAVITMGRKGYLAAEGDRVFRGMAVGAFGDDVVDTSGAGDGFLAAMTYKLAMGENLEAACKWANVYAGITVCYSGTIPGYLPLSQVEEFMTRR